MISSRWWRVNNLGNYIRWRHQRQRKWHRVNDHRNYKIHKRWTIWEITALTFCDLTITMVPTLWDRLGWESLEKYKQYKAHHYIGSFSVTCPSLRITKKGEGTVGYSKPNLQPLWVKSDHHFWQNREFQRHSLWQIWWIIWWTAQLMSSPLLRWFLRCGIGLAGVHEKNTNKYPLSMELSILIAFFVCFFLTFKVCFLCWEFISGHFRTGGWRRDLLEEEQLNTL